MLRSRIAGSFILVAAGLVWIGQGTGFLAGRSFMVGDPRWAWIGAGCVVLGVGLAILEIRRRRRP